MPTSGLATNGFTERRQVHWSCDLEQVVAVRFALANGWLFRRGCVAARLQGVPGSDETMRLPPSSGQAPGSADDEDGLWPP